MATWRQHNKKAVYGASMKKWSSHSVKSATEISHSASHPMTHHPKAMDADTRTRAIFLLPGKRAPYHVYCNPFYENAGLGSVFSTDDNAALKECIQNYDYAPD